MTTVPNWIAKAVVFAPSHYGPGAVQHVTDWRPTKTQVVVTADGRERRFYLDTLTEVGQSRYGPRTVRLLPPDAPEVTEAQRSRKVNNARAAVLAVIEKARLQDSTDDADATLTALEAIRVEVAKAMASLTEVL